MTTSICMISFNSAFFGPQFLEDHKYTGSVELICHVLACK